MSLTKKQAIKDLQRDKVSNQQALVKRIEGISTTKNIKKYIPGGKTLKDQLSKESFPKAMNNWLKHCRHFTEMEFSFLDPKPESTQETKVYDFNSKAVNFEWETRGKKWLAEVISEFVLKPKVAFVKVTKDGIYVHSVKKEVKQEDKNWFPYISFTAVRK